MIDPEALRKAQLIMLEMLIEFDALCKKHELQYWLDSGTLLGAVRHQGFIPWDDDIDLSMPLEDYQKLLQLPASEFSSQMFMQNRATDKHFKFDYSKLRSSRASIVEFHEKDQQVNYHQGVFIDIFPMLTMANSAEDKHYYEQTFAAIRDVSAISLHTPNGQDKPQTRAVLVAALQQYHQGWEQADSLVIYGGEMPDVAAYFDLSSVYPLSTIEFEGMEFPAPHNPSAYLDAIYSFDYRQLPPEDKRTIHAHSISFTE